MTKERLEWILAGLSQSRLNKLERKLIETIEEKFKQAQIISASEERGLERIYRSKGW